MRYWIGIFNKQPLGKCFEEGLTDLIKESHFQTLCTQYGLNPEEINPALSNLEVIKGKQSASPFFIVRYQPLHLPPLVVYHWPIGDQTGRPLFQIERTLPKQINDHIEQAVAVFEIELQPSQFKNMGLLIGYEVARQVAFEGDGIVYGLDGRWYRINRHKAFVPLNQ